MTKNTDTSRISKPDDDNTMQDNTVKSNVQNVKNENQTKIFKRPAGRNFLTTARISMPPFTARKAVKMKISHSQEFAPLSRLRRKNPSEEGSDIRNPFL